MSHRRLSHRRLSHSRVSYRRYLMLCRLRTQNSMQCAEQIEVSTDADSMSYRLPPERSPDLYRDRLIDDAHISRIRLGASFLLDEVAVDIAEEVMPTLALVAIMVQSR